MNFKWSKWMRRFQSSYWFFPGLMALLAVGTATAMWWLDYYLSSIDKSLVPVAYRTDAAGAQAILTTVAGSAISVASLVFSITVVVLSIAANQMGPRLLENFMKHNRTQIVLGAFIGTFIYCLLILATVSGQTVNAVPHSSVMLGLMLGIISFALLIYFIHHVLVFIQVSRVLEEVSNEVVTVFSRILLSEEDQPSRVKKRSGNIDKELPDRQAEYQLTASSSGYLQLVELDTMVALASEHDALVHIQCKPGDFLIKGSPLLRIWAEKQLEQPLLDKFSKSIKLGAQRTAIQDAEFAIDQLVEVALRALSPGINDSFTAINCVDRLAAALAEVASKRLPKPYYFDENDRLRVVVKLYSYRSILNAAFNPIRQNARNNVGVTQRLMETVISLCRLPISENYRSALMEHAKLIYAEAEQHFQNQRDFERFQSKYSKAIE